MLEAIYHKKPAKRIAFLFIGFVVFIFSFIPFALLVFNFLGLLPKHFFQLILTEF